MPDPISWAHDWPRYAAALGGGYLLGGIPFGLILAWLAGLGDIRKIGSGNIGATNVLRTGHKGLALLTVLLDGLKGTAAVLIAYHGSGLGLGGPDLAVTAGFGAFVGHCFPVWLAFRGGKGVATYLGILLGLYWPAMLAAAAVWIVVAFATRYSSLSAIAASAATPVVLFAAGQIQYAELFLALTLLLWLRHAANIRRLVRGQESRIGA